MIRHIGLWLVGCALCVTPVAADEDVYDGPTAIKPLTVTPQPQSGGRRNIGCGWWPIGSDADRDCAAGRRRF